jgi:CubicO group peptidase (beta-lactamase class C family)
MAATLRSGGGPGDSGKRLPPAPATFNLSAMKTTRRAFLQHVGIGAAGFYLGSSLADWPAARAAAIGAGGGLPRATPESQGVSSGAVEAFLDGIAGSKSEFHSFVLVRHGHVIAEGWWAPYAAELNHTMYSMSKSFTSTAIGLAVSDGKLTVEDPVVSFFPDDLPAKVDENLAALRVKHLLSMSVGHAKDSTGLITPEENWVRAFLALPIAHEPGSAFLYNSGATYMLSAIVTRLTGQKVIDYLRPRLFEPLAIEGMTWQTCPRGNNTGGWGLSIRTEGLAKFGQLYLQKGVWNDKQLIPAKWVDAATSFKIQQPLPATTHPARPNDHNDWLQGYCYQFWRCTHNAFRGDGAFGQFTIVMPEHDAVLAITGESHDLQGELDLVWQHLLPAMADAPLAEDNAAVSRLQQRLSSLALAPDTAGKTSSPRASAVSGKTFSIEPNNLKVMAVSFSFADDGCTFRLTDDGGEHPIACGLKKWVVGETDMPGTPPSLGLGRTVKVSPTAKVAASGTWTDDDTFEMTWRFHETPHHDTATCTFADDRMTLRFASSIVRMSPTAKDARPVLQGKLA